MWTLPSTPAGTVAGKGACAAVGGAAPGHGKWLESDLHKKRTSTIVVSPCKSWRGGRDSNSQPPDRQSGTLTKLSYRPARFFGFRCSVVAALVVCFRGFLVLGLPAPGAADSSAVPGGPVDHTESHKATFGSQGCQVSVPVSVGHRHGRGEGAAAAVLTLPTGQFLEARQ